jgi:hypothetical protein
VIHQQAPTASPSGKTAARKINMAISLVFALDLVKASIDGRLPHGMGVARLTDLPFPRAERFGRRPARIAEPPGNLNERAYSSMV